MEQRQHFRLMGLVDALQRVLPPGSGPYALHEPSFSDLEKQCVVQCIDEGWVSSAGRFIDQFEAELCRFTGVDYAVAVVNGTAALHLALHVAGVSAGDEVLIPALTFVATANAVHYCGAIPHFLDSNPIDFGIDPVGARRYLEDVVVIGKDGAVNRHTGRRIAALVAVHIFGHPSQIEELSRLCQEFGIQFIEDAAESLGSYYRGQHTGRFGMFAALSFNGNKVVTTGGGGAVLTSDETLSRKARHLATTAKRSHPWAYFHDDAGFNYRMPNINAALGCAQMARLPGFLADKRKLAETYRKELDGLDGIRFIDEPDQCRSNYWLNTILLDGDDVAFRDQILAALHERGIMARPLWTLLHRLPMYSHCPRTNLSCAENLERRLVNLPSSPFLMASLNGRAGKV